MTVFNPGTTRRNTDPQFYHNNTFYLDYPPFPSAT